MKNLIPGREWVRNVGIGDKGQVKSNPIPNPVS